MNTALGGRDARSAGSSSSSRRWRSPARSSASDTCRASAGTFPTDTPLFVVLVIGVIVVVAALTFLPVLALGPIVEQLGIWRCAMTSTPRSRPARPRPNGSAQHVAARPAIVRRAVGDSFVKLNPRTLMRNPVMFVVEVGSVLTTILFFTDLGSSTAERERVRRRWSRCSSGSPCCSPTSPRRSPRAGARRRPTRCARPASETVAHRRRRRRHDRGGAEHRARPRRRVVVVARAR